MADHDMTTQLNREGFVVLQNVLGETEVKYLCASLEELSIEQGAHQRGGSTYAVRNLLRCESVHQIATASPLIDIARSAIGEQARPVKAILFDKTPDANWAIRWHQDQTIAVKQKLEVEGFGPWSVKEGFNHVRAPAEVLDAMVTLRVHLDDCDEDNGALQVIPTSHAAGRLSPDDIQVRKHDPSVTCCVASGGVLMMKPLILHRSLPAKTAVHRRVIHIEYAANDLPGGLDWPSS